MITRTATRTRITAAAGALLAAISMGLTGCAGGGSDTFQNSSDTSKYIVFDGDKVYHVNGSGIGVSQAILDAIESKNLDPEADEYMLDTGTINKDQTVIVWEDGEDDDISVADDLVQFDGDSYIPYDSDQAESAREEKLKENE